MSDLEYELPNDHCQRNELCQKDSPTRLIQIMAKAGYRKHSRHLQFLMPICLMMLVSCADETAPTPSDQTSDTRTSSSEARDTDQPDLTIADSPLRFTEVGRQSGIDHTYYGSPSPQHYMTEQNGGGTALLDYDGDGTLDIFFVNGSHFEREAKEKGETNRLYAARGTLQYQDVTEATRLTAFGHGMGCAAGDYDNDGFVDLFVAYYGRNRLWRNNGDGTFDEVTAAAGVGDDRWGTSAAFADLDGDGNLDLYVVNYVEWSPEEPPCRSSHQPPVTISCSPTDRSGQPDLLFRNLGDGGFEEIGRTAGIAISETGKGLALGIADFDGDQRPDIVVANDTTPNFLFRNLGDFKFEDLAGARGVAYNHEGVAGSGMGVAIADYNQDGRFDFAVTNFLNQPNDLYENLGTAGFRAVNTQLGLDVASRPLLAFGIVFADYNLDSYPDLFVANGHIWDLTDVGRYEYQMQQQLLENRKGTQFAAAGDFAGEYFRRKRLGRSVASGDLDNDCDPDLVVTHLETPVELLRNDSTRAGQSLLLQLVGTQSSRQPLGARVEADIGSETFTTHVVAGGSFQSSSDPRVMISTRDVKTIAELRVFWPGGAIEAWQSLPATGHLTLLEGTGEKQQKRSRSPD